MLRESASRLLLPVVRNTLQKRCQSAVSGPPTQHVPKAEVFILGSSIAVSVLVIPIYVLLHIPSYKQK